MTMKNILHRLNAFLRIFLPFLGLSLLLEATFLSLLGGKPFSHLLYSLFQSAAYSVLIALPMAGLFLVFYKISLSFCRFLSIFYFGTLLLLIGALWAYRFESGVLLGADLYGYEISEIKTTLTASVEVPWAAIVGMVAMLLVYLFSVRQLKWERKGLGSIWAKGYLLLLIVGLAIAYDLDQKWLGLPTENKAPLSYFIQKSQAYYLEGRPSDQDSITDEAYPFYKAFPSANPLGNYFPSNTQSPNIVIIAVEGLGADFIDQSAKFGGFMPFLDSLSKESLYWPNTLSNTGRTYGVLPSLLGSLPYQGAGFMSLGVQMPTHQSLLSLLKSEGYHSAFYYGGNANFDKQDIFLERQQIDFLLSEEKFPSTYTRMEANTDGFSWGYADKAVFQYAAEKQAELKQPFVNFYMTLTTHEPFKVPEESYRAKVDNLIANAGFSSEKQALVKKYQAIFECLNYTDDALRALINSYKANGQYENTIFIITGDHRLIPMPYEHVLERFHVPLMVFSPILRQSESFEALSSHAQLMPSLLSLMKNNYSINMPDSLAYMGDPLSTENSFGSQLKLPLMMNKNQLDIYVDHETVLVEDRLYKLEPDFSLKPLSNLSQKQAMQQALKDYKQNARMAMLENKWTKTASTHLAQNKVQEASQSDQAFIAANGYSNTSPDSLLLLAKNYIEKNDILHARMILRHALNEAPNYHDLRILLAKTYAWNQSYDSATSLVKEVVRRAGNYEEAFTTLADFAYWQQDFNQSKQLALDGLSFYPESIELQLRIARIQMVNGETSKATKKVEEILKKAPDNELARQLKQQLNS